MSPRLITANAALAAAPLLGSAPVLADDPRLNSAGFAEIKRLKDAQKQHDADLRRRRETHAHELRMASDGREAGG